MGSTFKKKYGNRCRLYCYWTLCESGSRASRMWLSSGRGSSRPSSRGSDPSHLGRNLRKPLNTLLRFRKKSISPHKSFRRSYREDYARETNVPGMMYHIFATFRIMFKNWKLFLPLLVIAVIPTLNLLQSSPSIHILQK